ncbi:MAG: tail fiber protein [Bacteroidales bacterium]|nr:tail fiber protein [Bacteroidales bacterium]
MKKIIFSMVLLVSLAISSNAQEAFIGEIRMFAGNYAPRGWAFCEGQLLAINSNTALFSIIGTIYGGDGVSTFALPDLRGATVVGPDQYRSEGSKSQGYISTTYETGDLTLKTIQIHYIICTDGYFPSRN